MINKDVYGIYRAIRPAGVFPNAAWKIDNTPLISESEVLLDVKILNIDITSFVQIMEQSYGNIDEMSAIILDIIKERGKMHNLVTGTGGTLYGEVEQIGRNYKNAYGIHVGDKVVTLNSLTGIPLKLTKINKIDTKFAQIDVEGKAVLFENCPLYIISPKIETRIQISALEMMGEIAQTASIISPGMKVLIFGATSKMGLLCSLAAKLALGGAGELIGFHSKDAPVKEEIKQLFTRIELIETPSLEKIPYRYQENHGYFDVIINCSSTTLSEPLCTILTKNRGTIFFASWRSDSDLAGLAAEMLGKDLDMCFYKGYVVKQREFFRKLLCHYPDTLKLIVHEGLCHDFKYPWLDLINNKEKMIDGYSDKMEEAGKYVFVSPKSRQFLKKLLKVARFDCNVLVTGETGTGKEIATTIIHKNSFRKNKKLIKINCASIPEQLLESELFGYEKGAFTGSNPNGKSGLWEQADNGTLFLDEIGEIPLALQAKLLRALEENEIYRIGGLAPVKTNVRVICATNRNLWDMVLNKEFREDLYYRLNVFSVEIPPLRDRTEDIIPLVEMLTRKYNEKYNMGKSFSQDAKMCLKSLSWPGNIRELDNTIQRCFIDSTSPEISLLDINAILYAQDKVSTGKESAERLQKEILTDQEMAEKDKLIEYKRRYGSTRKIAGALGMSQSSVVRRLKKYGL